MKFKKIKIKIKAESKVRGWREGVEVVERRRRKNAPKQTYAHHEYETKYNLYVIIIFILI